ncbi:Uncharacterised protein [Legionella beliardensis]|uniref:Coiled coil protein n=1 Tax=Legionella beliardensis TaxID=91822 RepID=A0A378I4E2_9GAMM|nr:hypothetical protein [Legionella beliardensis]STX29702.1 Uncharacterised protein [Legionella beliardensis]
MIFFDKYIKPEDTVRRSLNQFKKELVTREQKLESFYSYLNGLKKKQQALLLKRQEKPDEKLDTELQVLKDNINFLEKKLLETNPEEKIKEFKRKYESLRAQFEA